jgi:hypothetical protein
MLLRGELPTDWQREILLRLEKIVYGGDTLAHDPNQLSLF